MNVKARGATRRTSRLARWLAGRNALRRPVDRIEGAVLVTLSAAFLVAVAVACILGAHTYQSQRAASAGLRPAAAMLIQARGGPAGPRRLPGGSSRTRPSCGRRSGHPRCRPAAAGSSGPADVHLTRNQPICSWRLAPPVGGRSCVSRWGSGCRVDAGAGKPAISPVRIPLIRICSRLRRGAGGGPGPLVADRGGSVLVVPQGAAGSVMALLPSRVGPGRWAVAGSVAGRASRGFRRLFPGVCPKPMPETEN